MMQLLIALWPEVLTCTTACVLLVLGALGSPSSKRLAPILAIVSLSVVAYGQIKFFGTAASDANITNSLGGGIIAQYIRLLAAVSGILFVLLAWPTGKRSGGNGSTAVGDESSEYFGLMLLSLAGLMLSAGANNTILLFLGLELASIPTYIMVVISRPIPIAQEAGVKYFFLGALSAAIMLLGFGYLYGVTGGIYLEGLGASMPGVQEHFGQLNQSGTSIGALEKLAIVLLVAGFSFKMAAFPLHVYAADVYQGAATPLTAMLSVVPKAAGLVAMIKIFLAMGGTSQLVYPHFLGTLLAVIAVLTMSAGNILALLQSNIKRTMAYSSVAHSGYMLAGLAAAITVCNKVGLHPELDQLSPEQVRIAQIAAIGATLFYIASYAIMNTGVFAVIQQLPAKARFGETATHNQLVDRGEASAETFDDIAGQGRNHPVLGVMLAVCALSLVGIPLTAGFLGKLLIAKPLITADLEWVLVVMMINAAISAGYYLKLPGAMFSRPLPQGSTPQPSLVAWPASLAVAICVFGTLAIGTVMPIGAFVEETARTAVEETFPRGFSTSAATPSATPAVPTSLTAPVAAAK